MYIVATTSTCRWDQISCSQPKNAVYLRRS